MSFTPFNSALGTRQGRVQPSGVTPSSGDFVFVLGSDVPGAFHNLEVGDRATLEQSVDLSAENFVRAVLRLRAPASMPVGVVWEASLLLDGIKNASVVVEPGRTRDMLDVAANVSKLTGVHTVALQLELVAV